MYFLSSFYFVFSSNFSHFFILLNYFFSFSKPTNHLDKGAKDWLGKYLSGYDGTLLVVSHDENLLQAAVSSIAEIRSGNIELYKSRSHDQWIVERNERVRNAQVAYDANQKEIARLQGFVDRFGSKTMGVRLCLFVCVYTNVLVDECVCICIQMYV